MPVQKIRSEKEFLRGFSTRLKQQIRRPSIYGYEPYEDPDTGRKPQLEFHTSNKKGRLFIGGNRSGKTVSGATEMVMFLIGQHRWLETPEPPVQCRCVSVDFTNGVEQIVKPEIARWLPPSALKHGSWEASYSKEYHTLTLDNESTLEFMSYDQHVEKFAGTSRHAIWFDEEAPEDIFDECMMRLIDTGGKWWMTMTPVEGMTWTFDDIYEPAVDGNHPDMDVIIVDSEMNPYVSSIEREILYAFLTADEKKARKSGLFIPRGGVIYPMFNPEIHVVPQTVPPRDWLWVASMDHGFTNPTSWHWSAVSKDGRILVFDEHYESEKVVSYHAQKVHEVNKMYERIPDYYVGDPTIRNIDPITGTSILIEYVDNGVPIVLGNNDQRAGINKVQQYLLGKEIEGKRYPKLFFTENCVNLIREIKKLRWATWANKKDDKQKNKKEEQHKKEDHACDDIRYLVASRPDDLDKDDGTFIPEFVMPVGASEAIDPTKEFYDKELVGEGPPTTQWYDPHLGSDY